MNLSTFDLNLLKTLLVLLQEKNTNRAAERLGTSQPAVSRTLAKLRQELDDPLFTRHARGLILTARAEQMAQELPEIMSSLGQTLQKAQFDPSRLSGKLSLALNGFLIESHGYQIYQKLLQAAPNLQLELHSYSPMTVSQLISGEIDAGINYYPLDISKELRQVPVGLMTFGMICRAGHPFANKVVDTADIFAFELTGLIVPDYNIRAMVAQKYADAGVIVKTHFRCQQVNPILWAVENSDMLFVAPIDMMKSLDEKKFASVQVSCDRNILEEKLALIFNQRHSGTQKFKWLESLITSVLE
ncbi:MAG: LysR family transcriptional regulator [Endozoicomonas sp.]